MKKQLMKWLMVSACLCPAIPALAQGQLEDYQRAYGLYEKFKADQVFQNPEQINWSNASTFHYMIFTENGPAYYIGCVNGNQAEGATMKTVNMNGVAQILSKETGKEVKAQYLRLERFSPDKEDTEKLGIMVGDIVCFDPRTTVTEKGYIKSRFLDDKLSVGILLGYAKYLKENRIELENRQYHYITVYEEVGHGGAASIPEGVTEMISVDMGCVGDGLTCDEHMVSICAKDSRGPYNYDVVTGLIKAAKDEKLGFAVDIYPYYGSDVDVTLCAGYDIRHGLIGAGVYASHGYERSHKDGVENTLKLLIAYCK